MRAAELRLLLVDITPIKLARLHGHVGAVFGQISTDSSMTAPAPRIIGIDAGGTMTDTFVVSDTGAFVVGKAQTTPDDESEGFEASLRDAFAYWDLDTVATMPGIRSCIYSGTSMLNRLLERKGRRVGLIVTAGMEDYLQLERGVQAHLGYSYADRLHLVTHVHNQPLVPRPRVFGVRGRIDRTGREVLPLVLPEATTAAEALLDADCEAICVSLIFSFVNPDHERRVAEEVRRVVADRGALAKVFVAHELYPTQGDFTRTNTVIVEAYAAEPSRTSLRRIAERVGELGGAVRPRIMASHGGTITLEAQQLCQTLTSGPIGGVIGAGYLGTRLGGSGNVVCTDIGGTSFDVALLTDNDFEIRPKPNIGRFLLNLPMVRIDSIGAGTGSYVRVNPTNRRIEIGPDSTGARIGVSYADGGVDTPSITDCNVVLGTINPDFFLGGEIVLDPDRAAAAVEEQIARPLGIDVHAAAAGVVELFEESLRNAVHALIVGRGYRHEDYSLLCYGGGGPLHVAGYAAGSNFQDVLIPSWAAGFSAFGCCCADYEYRFDKSVGLACADGFAAAQCETVANGLNAVWEELRHKVVAEFAKSGVGEEVIRYRHYARIKYAGQLNDIEVNLDGALAAAGRCKPDEVAAVMETFDERYERIYARGAKSPELGYVVTQVTCCGVTDVEKPALPDDVLAGPEPPAAAGKGRRPVYAGGQWRDADIWNMEALATGNQIAGPAVIESPATTLVVPADLRLHLDGHRIFHLEGDQ
jgi:N-methylhydantoinase A/acetone carboxylase beta subunit